MDAGAKLLLLVCLLVLPLSAWAQDIEPLTDEEEESGYQALEECSVVAAPYQVDGRVVGMLGVVGPTRMPYAQVIQIVDVTARLLGGALSSERSR